MYAHVYVHLKDKNNAVFVIYTCRLYHHNKCVFERSMFLSTIHVLKPETFICYDLAKMLDTNYRMIYYITVDALLVHSIQYTLVYSRKWMLHKLSTENREDYITKTLAIAIL